MSDGGTFAADAGTHAVIVAFSGSRMAAIHRFPFSTSAHSGPWACATP